jgi:hypothetical protein
VTTVEFLGGERDGEVRAVEGEPDRIEFPTTTRRSSPDEWHQHLDVGVLVYRRTSEVRRGARVYAFVPPA